MEHSKLRLMEPTSYGISNKIQCLILLESSLRRWMRFVRRRKCRIFIANTHRLLADELAIYYFVRKCFYRFVGRLKARLTSMQRWKAATRRVKLKEKFPDRITLKKQQRLSFQYWYLSHKVIKYKKMFFMKVLIKVVRVRKLVRALHVRYLRNAFFRWIRRSRWPLVEAKYKNRVYSVPIKRLRLGVLCRYAQLSMHVKAHNYHVARVFRKIIERARTFVRNVSTHRNGKHQLRRNLLFYAVKKLYRNFQLLLNCPKHLTMSEKHYEERNKRPVYIRWLHYVFQHKRALNLYNRGQNYFIRTILKYFLTRSQKLQYISTCRERAIVFQMSRGVANAVSMWTKRVSFFQCCSNSVKKADFYFRFSRLQQFRKQVKRSFKQICSMKNSFFLRRQRSLSRYLKFWHLYAKQVSYFRLVNKMIRFHHSFRRLLLRTKQHHAQHISEERAHNRFEYLVFRKTFRRMCQYYRRRKSLRINYKTCRQIWGLNGVGKNQDAHPCSRMGQAFFMWRNVSSKASCVRKSAECAVSSISRRRVLNKIMNHWEEISGFTSCKYQVLSRKFSDWVYFHHVNLQLKLSDEIICVGRRHLIDVKLKYCLRRWLNITRQHVQQKIRFSVVRQNNYRSAAEVARLSVRIRLFRTKFIFLAWMDLNANRRYEMNKILIRMQLKSYFRQWTCLCYARYIKCSLDHENMTMSPAACCLTQYSRLSGISGKFYRRMLSQSTSNSHTGGRFDFAGCDRNNASLITLSPSVHDITINDSSSVLFSNDPTAHNVSNTITGVKHHKSVVNFHPAVCTSASVEKSPPRSYLAYHLYKLREREKNGRTASTKVSRNRKNNTHGGRHKTKRITDGTN